MIKQTLIVAGSYGTRLSPSINTTRNKSLIEYGGQSMIGHLIDGLRGGGIERYVIASGYHNNGKIRRIAMSKNIDSVVVPIEGGFRKVPYYLQDLLDERFMLVCGHHPIPADFVQRMLQRAEDYECIIAAYNNATCPLNKRKRIIYENDSGAVKLRIVDTEVEDINGVYRYVRNPYIIGKAIVRLLKEDGFQWTFSHYVYEHWLGGGSLGVVEAPMPPEFDYDEEFERTKNYLDSLKF